MRPKTTPQKKNERPKQHMVVRMLLFYLPIVIMVLASLYAVYGVYRMVHVWSVPYPEFVKGAALEERDPILPKPTRDQSGWFFFGTNWKCKPNVLNSAELEEQWHSPQFPKNVSVPMSDWETLVLELLQTFPFSIREANEGVALLLEHDDSSFRVRFAVSKQPSQRLLYGALAILLDDSNWSLIELTPTDTADTEEPIEIASNAAQMPLPMPENCVPVCVRIDSSGSPVFALVDCPPVSTVSYENIEPALLNFWQSRGWSVELNGTDMTTIFPLVCRKNSREIGVRFVHAAGLKAVLLDLKAGLRK